MTKPNQMVSVSNILFKKNENR